MNAPRILKDENYTFSKYFDLPYRTSDILADLGCTFARSSLLLPVSSKEIAGLDNLKMTIARNLRRVLSVTETSKREAIVSPILIGVCEEVDALLDIEYPISVSNWLKGTLDYLVIKSSSLLVIEAKQSDLDRGFTQLAVELIALDRWIDSDSKVLYGAVTTGDSWRFGTYDRAKKLITQDIKLYRVPEGLEGLVKVLIGILD